MERDHYTRTLASSEVITDLPGGVVAAGHKNNQASDRTELRWDGRQCSYINYSHRGGG